MSDLYVNMGFFDNPFSKFSAEEEKKYIGEIYKTPKYYNVLLSEIKEGNSRYLFGERGIGKSALMFHLLEDLNKYDVFPVLIDEYDNVGIKDNGESMLRLIEHRIITMLSITLWNDVSKLKKINKYEKEKLAFLIDTFFETLGKSEVMELYEEVSGKKKINFFKRLYNGFFVSSINAVLSGVSNVLGSTVNKALGLPQVDNSVIYQEFIQGMEIVNENSKFEIDKIDYKGLKNIIRETAKLINKLGFGKLIIFFDKVDEYRPLQSNLTNMADFLEIIATDTSLIYAEEFGMEFILWNKVKPNLKDKQVRFDKTRPIDINWNNEELLEIVNNRLTYFSNNKVKDISEIMEKQEVDNIIKIANGSPRQLIMLLGRIYEEQAKININVNRFSIDAIENGKTVYCQEFEYELLYPKSQIKTSVEKILKVGKKEFEINDLASTYKKSVQSASNWTRSMRDFGLIDEIDGDNGRTKKYKVTDPKLVYLIERKLSYKG